MNFKDPQLFSDPIMWDYSVVKMLGEPHLAATHKFSKFTMTNAFSVLMKSEDADLDYLYDIGQANELYELMSAIKDERERRIKLQTL